ncbi:MAG: Vms1/Ankzf1 family peptidyl-tRNA hydrolase, partial [Nakamurella sp.]
TGLAGPHGRLVVADPDGIALDLVLPDRPVRNEVHYGPAPHLLPAFRALHGTIPHLLAEVDRTGADITVVDLLGTDADHVHVQGTHDVVHKVPGGQTSQRRMQGRAEDSWARNAAEVAKELDTLVAQHRPAAVLLAGDVTAVGDVVAAASGQVKDLAIRLTSGGRASGASAEALAAEVKEVLADQQQKAAAGLLDRFNTAEGRQEAAVQSLEDVVDAARRMQVEELLLHDNPMSTLKLWIGDEPGQLGLREVEVRSLGATNPRQVRADTALIWALVYADSGITLLDPEQRDLEDGVGALLRYADRSTPHDEIYSMPGRGTNKGAHHRGE